MILWDKINAMINVGFKIANYRNTTGQQVISVKRGKLNILIDVKETDTPDTLLKKLYDTEKRFETTEV